MVNWAGLLCQKMAQPVTVSPLLAAMGDCVMECDRGNNRIVAIDFAQRQSRVVASHIDGPCAVAVDIASRSLFVGEWEGRKRLLTYKY